jgi:hypothetical protein
LKPDFSFSRGIATCAWSDPAVALKFDLMRSERRTGELSAEVTATSGTNGSTGLLHRARIRLDSTRSLAEFSNHLGRRLSGPDWPGLVEAAAWKVIEAYRQGPPAFMLRDAVEPPATGWALKPILLGRDPVILFADGGQLKSYQALAFAVSLQNGVALTAELAPSRPFRVAYLDWEWTEWPHKRRLRALCGPGELPELLYVPCQSGGPLSQQVERIQRIFEQHRIDYAVIDSVGLACDGPPEEAQSALGFFQALGRLEVGSLLIAHTSRAEDTSKPFGSVFWHNSARGTWLVKRIRTVGTTAVDVGLYQRKANDGALRDQPIGLRFDFAGGSTTVTAVDLDEARAQEVGTTAGRMANLLAAAAMTDDEIATKLGVSAATVRSVLKRHSARFMRLPDRSIGLVLQ